jgi:hypothetical protein
VNALKRAIHAGRVSPHQAKRSDELQAVTEALALLANIVMAWNTDQIQSVSDGWKAQRGCEVRPELIAKVAPTRLEGINLPRHLSIPGRNLRRTAPAIVPDVQGGQALTPTFWRPGRRSTET